MKDLVSESRSAKYPRSTPGLWVFRIAFICGVCVLVLGSLLPARMVPAVMNDKAEHFLAYAALAAVGIPAFRTRQGRLLLVLSLLILAVAMEIGQAFSVGRSSEFADALAGWTGTCFAFIPSLFTRRRPLS